MSRKVDPFNCEGCGERIADQIEGAVDFGGTSFCSRECAKEYGYTCGRPIHREMLDDVEVLPEGESP